MLVVPAGILFAADRNVTLRIQADVGRGITLERAGQIQRPKVLKWPNRELIVGYFGLARIAGLATDRWLYSFIGRHLDYASLAEVAEALASELQADVPSEDAIAEPLIVHLAGFDDVDGELAPVVWFIRNTTELTPRGAYRIGGRFEYTEELRAPLEGRFGGMRADEIREEVGRRAGFWQPFWFRQGTDLATFNLFDGVVRTAMQWIVERHPLRLHPFPESLAEWERHARLGVLALGAYYEAFYPPYEQAVGGGADVVSARWPDP